MDSGAISPSPSGPATQEPRLAIHSSAVSISSAFHHAEVHGNATVLGGGTDRLQIVILDAHALP